MDSLAEPRRCAHGARCVRYDPATHKPEKLSRYNSDPVCEACQREEAVRHEEVSPEHTELFSSARLLFRAGIEDEDQIIPTLVFAANLGEMPNLREVKDGLAALTNVDAKWKLNLQVSLSFDTMVALMDTIDGVPILQLSPFVVTNVTDEQGSVAQVVIDVFMRSVQAEKVAEIYERNLKRENVEIDPIRGDISYKLHEDLIRIIARPETMSIDVADGRILPLRSGPPRLPDPLIVAGMYEVLRGSRSPGMIKGFRSVLAGRERGKPSGADILVPACVGWYVAGRGDLSGQTEERRRVVRILNQELLEPCGKEHQGESSSRFWRDVRNVSDAIERLERALHRRARDTWTS
jgi:hypothetical protein